MSNEFNADLFLNTVQHKAPIAGYGFAITDAANRLLDNPNLGQSNRHVTGLTWSSQAISEDSVQSCLVARHHTGKVIIVLYAEGSRAMAACEKEMPDDVLLAMSDILQCLAAGNEPWIRTDYAILQAAFDTIFIVAPRVEFRPEWSNGTGYLNGACDAKYDEVKSFVDSFGRRAVLLPCVTQGQKEKSVVIFERYANNEETPLVFNAPSGYTSATTGLVNDVTHLHQRLLEEANIELAGFAM